MPIKVVAIFVACSIDLLSCGDLPFIESQHVFSDPDICRATVIEISKKETEYRITNKYPKPIVMGKCKWWLDERDLK